MDNEFPQPLVSPSKVATWFSTSDVVDTAVLLAFLLAVTIVWLEQPSRWTNLITSLWVTIVGGDEDKTGGWIEPGEEPHVTVQICLYNEVEVIGSTIDHACCIDWPTDKLHIQVLDDSTDQACIALVKEHVSSWQEKGVDIQRLCRPDRVGYKAGNLRYSFDKIVGDYAAYLDADHRAEPDFLKNLLPFFFDNQGCSKDKIGLVQAPWGYYNAQQNVITASDAIGLDCHHTIDQVGRATRHKFFGFNGTGGVWRKQAIQDAGGFTWETVTEDAHVAFLAHLKGYEFVYARHFPQLLEVPSGIVGQVIQKGRWTKGGAQIFRMYFWDICNAPETALSVKVEIVVFLSKTTLALTFMWMEFLFPFVNFSSRTPLWFYAGASVSCFAVGVLELVFASLAKVSGSDGVYNNVWSRLHRLRFIVPYICLRCGMSVFQCKALLEGLFSDDATFHVTPKEGVSSSFSPLTKAKLNCKAKRSMMDDLAACVGMIIVPCKIIAYARLNNFLEDRTCLLATLMFFWHLCSCIGLLSVSLTFLWEKHCSSLSCRYKIWRTRMGRGSAAFRYKEV